MKRIGITGPESTGKTTLSQMLATYFHVECVPEYSRAFLTERNGQYTQSDLDQIADGQLQLINEVTSGAYLIADTEMLVMKIWSEFKYGNCSDHINRLWNQQDFDLYLLCAPDIPYEYDELREHPESREALFELYKAELERSGRSFIICQGEPENRLQQAIEAIEQL